MDALLLLVPLARAHNMAARAISTSTPIGRITGRRKPGRVAPFVYTGVQILSPRADARRARGAVLDQPVLGPRDRGRARLRLRPSGLWFDVGTPPAIAKTEALLIDA